LGRLPALSGSSVSCRRVARPADGVSPPTFRLADKVQGIEDPYGRRHAVTPLRHSVPRTRSRESKTLARARAGPPRRTGVGRRRGVLLFLPASRTRFAGSGKPKLRGLRRCLSERNGGPGFGKPERAGAGKAHRGRRDGPPGAGRLGQP